MKERQVIQKYLVSLLFWDLFALREGFSSGSEIMWVCVGGGRLKEIWRAAIHRPEKYDGWWMGLGDLGSPMAANLLESGYELTVYNRSRSKAEPLVERGARIADESQQVAEKGGVVVSILWNSDVTENLITPKLLARLEGGIHVGMCTGSPDAAKRLAKLHAERPLPANEQALNLRDSFGAKLAYHWCMHAVQTSSGWIWGTSGRS